MSSRRPDDDEPREYLAEARQMSTPEIKDEQQYEAHMDAAINYNTAGIDKGVLEALERAEDIGNKLDPPRNAEMELEERVKAPDSSPLHKELSDREIELKTELQSRGESSYKPSPEWEYDHAVDYANIIHGLDDERESVKIAEARQMSTPEIKDEQQYEAHMDAAINYNTAGIDKGVLEALERAEDIGNKLDPPRNAEMELEERVKAPDSSPLHKELSDREIELKTKLQSRGESSYKPSPEWEYDHAKDYADVIHGLDDAREGVKIASKEANTASRTATEVQRELVRDKDKDKNEPER